MHTPSKTQTDNIWAWFSVLVIYHSLGSFTTPFRFHQSWDNGLTICEICVKWCPGLSDANGQPWHLVSSQLWIHSSCIVHISTSLPLLLLWAMKGHMLKWSVDGTWYTSAHNSLALGPLASAYAWASLTLCCCIWLHKRIRWPVSNTHWSLAHMLISTLRDWTLHFRTNCNDINGERSVCARLADKWNGHCLAAGLVQI